MRDALKKNPAKTELHATEKSRLIKAANDSLIAAHKINERDSLSPENAVKWYDDNMAGVSDIKTLAGAMEIEMRTRRGLAVEAEGERRGGNRKVSGEPTLSGAEKTQRHDDRTLAKNEEAVGQYVQDSIESGEVPTVTGALRAAKPKKHQEAKSADSPESEQGEACVVSFTAPASLAKEIDQLAEEQILRLPAISFSGDGKHISLAILEPKSPDGDRYWEIIALGDAKFEVVIDYDKWKVLADNYVVRLSKQGVVSLSSDDLTYYITYKPAVWE